MAVSRAVPYPSRLKRWRLPEGGWLEVFSTREPERNFAPHWHEEWSLGAVLEGRCRFSCQGQACEAAAGDLVLLPPRALHTAGVAAGAFCMTMAYLPHPWLARRLGWPPDRVPSTQPVLRDPAAAVQLAAAAELPDPAQLLERVAETMARWTATPASTWRPLAPALDPRLEQLCRVLQAAGAVPPEVGLLALQLGVSREHLYRLFRKALGLSPGAYARLARIAQAKQLLGEGRPPAEAAALCGFADQAHFSRWFRRCLGVTPRAYRPAGAP